MTRRPRFNGSPDDHARTEQWLSQLQTTPEDGTTVQFTGASIIGLPVDVTAIAIQAGPAPLASYRSEPASFPALQAAPASFPALPGTRSDRKFCASCGDTFDGVECPNCAEQAQAGHVLAAVPVTEAAVIGDDLRLPHVWCEMPSCINFHRDPASLGERDARDRATAHGWRHDALGRLACPPCQQTRADYRTPQPVTWQHPGIPRRWHEHGTLPTEETQDRLTGAAEYARYVTRKHPGWAAAMAGATRRTAGAS